MKGFELQASYGSFRLDASAEWEARTMALFGASGSGKSTVLEAMAGARPEVTGAVFLNGERIDGLPAHKRGIGWVPQDAMLFPERSVRENLELAARWRGNATSLGLAIEALDLKPLLERRAAHLSGGERQRVAIGRALASGPRLLLLDEPLASIDRPLRSRLVPYLRRIPDELKLPLVIVSHDPVEVVALAEHVVVLAHGTVVEEGDPRSVFHSSSTFGAFDLGGAENRFEVVVVEQGAGVLTVRTGGGAQLVMAVVAGFPTPKRVAVRGEDVVLSADPPGRVSAQNVLSGEVVGLEPIGEHAYVSVAAGGEVWRIKVTQLAVSGLELSVGRTLHLMIKAHAVFGVG